ncbi:MAG TPA: hypothetical protein PLL53_07355 [Saprospiraceae bacterium]|nr:hypothetical protein [Saprospiraceae bacterium]
MNRFVFFFLIFTASCSQDQATKNQMADLDSAYQEVLILAEKANQQAEATCRMKENFIHALQPLPYLMADIKAVGNLHTALQTQLNATLNAAENLPADSPDWAVPPATISSIQSSFKAFEEAVRAHFPDEEALPDTPAAWLNKTSEDFDTVEYTNISNRLALVLMYHNLSTQAQLLYTVYLDQALDKQYADMAAELERKEGGFGIAPVLNPVDCSPKAGDVFQAQILASPYLYSLGGDVHIKVNGAGIPCKYGLGWYEAPASPGRHTINVEMAKRNPKTGEISSVQTQYQYTVE